MVPYYISKTLLFWNRTLFRGIGLDRPPQSFDEILDVSRRLTSGEKSGFLTLNFDWLYWPLFQMNGVELLSPQRDRVAFNTPKGIEVVGNESPMANICDEISHAAGILALYGDSGFKECESLTGADNGLALLAWCGVYSIAFVYKPQR